MFHLMSLGHDGLNANRFAHHFWLRLTESQRKSGLRLREVPENLRRNVYDFSDKISQPLVFYLPRQSRPGTAPFEPPSHPLNHFAFSQRATVKLYLPLRFKLQPWREPCLWRPGETPAFLTLAWHMGRIRKHQASDVTTVWPRGDRFAEGSRPFALGPT